MAKAFIRIIALLLSIAGQSEAASPKETYLETRDEFIRQFSTASAPEANSNEKALSKLEKQLQLIIGPVDIPHFPKTGKINLETLYQDAGFGQVDGLRFDSRNETLFVTTTGLLGSYLRQHKELPTELGKLVKDEEFYRLVFDWDVAVTHFAEIPVQTGKDKSYAYAFLGLLAQDIGPFLPEHLFVFFLNGDHVLIVSTKVQNHIDQIPECKDVWDQFEMKSKDQKSTEDTNRYEDEGFDAYCRCFEQKAKTEPFLKPLIRQAQSIVRNLQEHLPQ